MIKGRKGDRQNVYEGRWNTEVQYSKSFYGKKMAWRRPGEFRGKKI